MRAAAVGLVITLTVLLAGRGLTTGGRVIPLQGAVVFGLGVALSVLSAVPKLSRRSVRALEFAVFGLTSVYLSAWQYQQMTVWTERRRRGVAHPAR